MDLWEVTGGRCHLGSAAEEGGFVPGCALHVQETDDGVLLTPLRNFEQSDNSLPSQGLVAQDESRDCFGNSTFSLSCCRRKSPGPRSLALLGADGQPALLRRQDLLGAVLNRPTGVLRLVHCPRVSGRRTREDVLICVEGGEAVLDSVQDWARGVSEHCCVGGCRPRKLLVFINPASGSGQASNSWAQSKELWTALPWISTEEVFTTRAGHARETVQQVDPSSCDGIVIVSGDGLVHEVFNGLSSRRDAGEAMRIPIGHIPGGSGNGLAKSVLHACGEGFGVLDAAFIIGKGGQQPLDLMTVSQPNQPLRTSFLSLAGGVIADIDLGSESLRSFGNLRFTLYAVVCVAWPRPLKGQLVYWPAEAPDTPSPSARPDLEGPLPEGPWVTVEDDFTAFWAMNTAWASSDSHIAPGQALDSGSWSLVLLRNAGRVPLTQFLLAIDDGSHVGQEKVEVIKCRAFRLTPRAGPGLLSLDGEEVPLAPIQVWPAAHPGFVIGASSALSLEEGGELETDQPQAKL